MTKSLPIMFVFYATCFVILLYWYYFKGIDFNVGIIILFLVFGYRFIREKALPSLDNFWVIQQGREKRRKKALQKAKIYLLPYTDIWKNLKLSNKFCSISLDVDGVTINAKEKLHPYRKFKVIESKVHSYEELWNMFCIHFNSKKSYDELVRDCGIYKVSIYEFLSKTDNQQSNKVNFENKDISYEKIDINNCTETELLDLPGINIIMSKRIIKKRTEILGFKSIEEFFLFLNISSNLQDQIKDKIYIKEFENQIQNVKYSSERSIDL